MGYLKDLKIKAKKFGEEKGEILDGIATIPETKMKVGSLEKVTTKPSYQYKLVFLEKGGTVINDIIFETKEDLDQYLKWYKSIAITDTARFTVERRTIGPWER